MATGAKRGAPPEFYWKPGTSPYADWLKTLTPEELVVHKVKRAQKKSMKLAFQKVVDAQQEIWISRINEGMLAVLTKAIREGDPAAMACVFDRVVGKPADTINTDSNQILPWSDIDKSSDDAE